MEKQIFKIKKGINTCYIIREKGCVMFDAGPPQMRKTFLKKLNEFEIEPSEIKLIILSHADFDHAGSTNEIREITGAKVLIHEKDQVSLESGAFGWPKGASTWGKITRALFSPILKLKFKPEKVVADIVLTEKEMDLNEYGVQGRIIHTTGHSPGSLSVLLDSGELFAGCLAHNLFPMTLKAKLPIYADNIEVVKESWKAILPLDPIIAYPAHGKAFPVEKIKKYL